jgi:hypothetical protein
MDVTSVQLTGQQAEILASWMDPWVEIYLQWRYGPGHWFYLNHWHATHELLL